MNILICPNSYKECADSVTISDIIAEEFGNSTNHNLFVRPLTDGGDGFLKVCEKIFDIKELNLKNKKSYVDDLNIYQFKYSEKSKRVFLESAELFGLKNTPKSNRNPMRLNTAVLGKILFDLSHLVRENLLDIKSVWIGIGGTATIDFGIGACSQLGLKLIDGIGNEISSAPENFIKARKLEFKKLNLPFSIKCIVDVDTELIGNPGAIEIYGPQKGASDNDLLSIKNGMKNILELVDRDLKIKIPEKLNGAGGGLAAGLNIFFGANIISAKEFILNEILKDIEFNSLDAVITGEGKFDSQSLEGKSAGVIIDVCKEDSIPLFMINGSSEIPVELKEDKHIHFINLIDFYKSKAEAIERFDEGIKRSIEKVMSHLNN